MKNLYIFGLLLVVLFAGCNKEDNETTKSNKLEDQQWFKDIQQSCNENEVCKPSLQKAVYNNDTVYYVMLSGPLCDAVSEVNLIDVYGNLVKHYDSSEMNDVTDEVTFLEMVYRCDE